MTVQLLKLLFWYLEWWDCGLWDWEDETGVCVTGPLRYCFDTWSDETTVDETGDDETGVMRLPSVRLEQWEYCFFTWTDETRVDETGDDETRVYETGDDETSVYETRVYETVDYETWVWETGKMRVLAGAHETNLDELKTIITLVLTFNI